MNNTHSLKLIDGKFTPSEARKVIVDLLTSKINYHTLEAFSIKERFNGDVSYSEKRIGELKQSIRLVEEILREASEKGYDLKVESTIEITYSKKEG
ncbi:MAG: hypothetical protein JSS79_16705 [Bacteroidetes bacterium]|nr:hypothetical protein [Bacteroidota bacterium]